MPGTTCSLWMSCTVSLVTFASAHAFAYSGGIVPDVHARWMVSARSIASLDAWSA
jgi:hypothetical protein